MAAALIPALQAGGSALISASPSLVSKIKSVFPTAYKAAANTFGLSNTTPEQVAGQAAKTNNAMMTNALVGTFVKSGVPPQWISDHFPVLTSADVTWLENAYADITKLERDMTTKPAINGDPDIVLGHLVKLVEGSCRSLGVSSEQLADLMTLFNNHGVADIRRYQKFKLGINQRPM